MLAIRSQLIELDGVVIETRCFVAAVDQVGNVVSHPSRCDPGPNQNVSRVLRGHQPFEERTVEGSSFHQGILRDIVNLANFYQTPGSVLKVQNILSVG